MKKHGKSYYFSSFFFPKKTRIAIYAFYAWVRTLDDIVDETKNKIKAKEDFDNWVKDWRKTENGEITNRPEMKAFFKVFQKFKIKKEYTDSFIDSMKMDLEQKSYKTLKDLEVYMYGSATVVGFIIMQILGNFKEEAKVYAKYLAEGMQLTNFLRDIGDDFRKRGRIYLPEEELKKYELDLEDAKNQRLCRPFIKFKINQARELFKKSEDGIKYLPKKAQFPILLSSRLYEAILNEIEKQNCDVFIKRARTTFWQKIIITFKTYLWYRKNM
jgi:phytoene synthase